MSEISTLYLKTHNKTGLQYLGVTYKDPSIYEGSGVHWKRHIRKHGRHDVDTLILSQDKMIGKYTSDKFQEMSKEYSHAHNVVKDKGFANKMHETGVLGAKDNVWHGFDDVYDKWDNKLNKDKKFVKTDIDDVTNHYDQVDVELKEMGNQEEVVTQNAMKKLVSKMLSLMTPREERVMRMRYGIGTFNTPQQKYDWKAQKWTSDEDEEVNGEDKYYGNEMAMTSEQIGQTFSVGRGRILQIEAKVLRKLRHPENHSRLVTSLLYG